MKRREFVLLGGAAALLRGASTGWDEVPAILKRIQAPKFPDRVFPIVKYGAKPDGMTDCTAAFKNAIAACNKAGGGRVEVPAGQYLTGPIHLLSNVNLHIAEGATVLFTQDYTKYLPLVYTRWEGVECMNYSPFIYAWRQRNIAVTGKGTLDGQCDKTHWWHWKGNQGPTTENQAAARKKLFDMGEKHVPVAERMFGTGSYLRPNFIQPYHCENVLIEDITILRSPMWEINPVLCRNVTVRGVQINTHGPNNDGCDPECCTDVLIENCYFDTGDDCIAIKSGRNGDGRRVNMPTENVIIRGCVMKDGHGGVTLGSEATGGIRNVYAENCRMDSPNLDRALRLKTNAVRGGFLENIYLRNITVGQVSGAAVDIDLTYEEGRNGNYLPTIRNINVDTMTCKKSKQVLMLRGYADQPIDGVHIANSTFENAAQPDRVENVKNLTMVNVTVNGVKVAAGA